jgi:predicted transglutaminase-like cysteine proteinase
MLLGLVAVMALTGGAEADPRYLRIDPHADEVTVPDGFDRFCARYPRECHPYGPLKTVSAAKWKNTIVAVNKRVNRQMTPAGPVARNTWRIGTDPADCASYVITKRSELIKAGIPRSALRMAVVISKNDIHHLVLVVSTDDGDRVLDNLTDLIWTPDKTEHRRWLSVQDTEDPTYWHVIGG